jgi:extracellular factor (EF) 3-hydroxypalmitic acid methyl ester biosynthesis protein
MTQNPPDIKPLHRFRARRLRADEINLGFLSASARHSSLGSVSGVVRDLSYYGVAIQLGEGGNRGGVVLGGDRLDDLNIADADGNVLFRGTAFVRRVDEQGADLVLGAEFEKGGIDLGEIHRRGTRRSFGERWKDFTGRSEHSLISSEFKAWVLDVRIDLERIKNFLDGEEKALSSADDMTRQEALSQYLAEVSPAVVDRLNRASRELVSFVENLPEDQEPAWRTFVRTNLGHLFDTSPFMRRASHKPLGYAGDYEMMNMLYRDHAEGASIFGRAMNIYATQEAPAQANINRIELLLGFIREALVQHPTGRIRIASVGCGPAKEIAAALERYPEVGARLDIALIDQEERSIAYCERTLTPLANRTGARIQFIKESIRRLLVAKELSRALGHRELVYSAGLFDYLNERSFSALLSSLYETLTPNGVLAVGNVAINNPSRAAMEYFLEWFLIHRSADDLRRQASTLSPTPAAVEVCSEPLGVNLFLSIRR